MSSATDPRVSTARGRTPSVKQGPTPTEETLPDGQKADHWVLSEAERAKGFIRPVRLKYLHVGATGPTYPLRDLTAEERELFRDYGYVKFEAYPPERKPALGSYWTQARLDAVGTGCGAETRMPQACAETYAREPSFYGRTFCCACGDYFPVGPGGEFVWSDGGGRVGT